MIDLLGGIFFNVFFVLLVEYIDKKIKVLLGLNFLMLMEVVLFRMMFEYVDDFVDKVIILFCEGIVDFFNCFVI